MYVYQSGTLWSSQVDTFTCVVPSSPDENGIIIFTDLVLPMGWVDSPKFFCDFSLTLTDVSNALVNTYLPVRDYGAISDLPSTGPVPPHTHRILAYIDCHMDDVIYAVQGGGKRQH